MLNRRCDDSERSFRDFCGVLFCYLLNLFRVLSPQLGELLLSHCTPLLSTVSSALWSSHLTISEAHTLTSQWGTFNNVLAIDLDHSLSGAHLRQWTVLMYFQCRWIKVMKISTVSRCLFVAIFVVGVWNRC